MKTIKGIDTNVLIRYLVQDDANQSKIAAHFIQNNTKDDNLIFINDIVLCELVWVLESGYDYSKNEIAQVLEMILRTRQFLIFNSDIFWKVLSDYQKLNVDFADSYIAHINFENDCTYTATFDKKATRIKHFKILAP